VATLVDTSVWIDHFRRGNSRLIELLEKDEVLIHPLIIGEVACGNLRKREMILGFLTQLPSAQVVTFDEGLAFIEKHKIFSEGIGIVDVQILASSLLSKAKLFTLDKKLKQVFESL
jgi:predicted nucleic acid-binding protein